MNTPQQPQPAPTQPAASPDALATFEKLLSDYVADAIRYGRDRKQLPDARLSRAALIGHVAALAKDKARLDWLNADVYVNSTALRQILPLVNAASADGLLRSAIDAAMRKGGL